MTDGEKIAKAAAAWLGTPHINGAKIKGRGVDCGMLLIGCVEDAELLKKDSVQIESYSNEWHLHHSEEWFLSYVQKYCDEVETMQPGDFLLYQFGRCISHGAVYVGKGRAIHAYIDRGVVMTDLSDVMFYDAKGRSRLRGIYRFNKKKVRR